ncbi:MAG: type II secretion system F family protein [Candidatus Micrarchaeota archaeon]
MGLFVFKYGGVLNGHLRRFVGIGNQIGRFVPGLKYDLREAGYAVEAGEYVAAALANSFYYGLILFCVLFISLLFQGSLNIAFLSDQSPANIFLFLISLKAAWLAGFVVFIVFMLFFLVYPKVEARKIGENVDRDLIYALKDMELQIASGVSLYDAMANVARADYGRVSKEFDLVVREIASGGAEDKALERMAGRTESEFMRKTIWQMLTSLRAGSSLEGALRSTIETLNNYQRQQIKSFAGELNILTLMFMLFAVAIPGLGSTLLIVLSSFGGIEVSELFYVSMISGCFFIEMVIIGFIKNRRPLVHA